MRISGNVKKLLGAAALIAVGAFGNRCYLNHHPEKMAASINNYYAGKLGDSKLDDEDRKALAGMISSAYATLEKDPQPDKNAVFFAAGLTDVYGRLAKSAEQAKLPTLEETINPDAVQLAVSVSSEGLYTGLTLRDGVTIPLRETTDGSLIAGSRSYARHACWEDGKQGAKDYVRAGKDKLVNLFK